ncbi:MAG: YciI family protein [Armatimonadota bacterium]
MIASCILAGISALAMSVPNRVSAQEPEFKMRNYILCVLETAPNAPLVESVVLNELQADHLEFLEGLRKQKRALAIGPLEEAGTMRGLVFFDAEKVDKPKEWMASEPMIKRGLLKPRFVTWYASDKTFRPGGEFLDLEALWFAKLDRPEGLPALDAATSQALGEAHMTNINLMAKEEILLAAGPMGEDAGNWRGIYIFADRERAEIEAAVMRDAMFKQGRLKLGLYRWYTSRGTFGPVEGS